MLSDNLPLVKDLPSPQGRWELVEVIGEGNYGEVFKARSVETGEMAAVKVMEAVLDKEEDIKAELNVFENHSHHPNIVSFYGAFVKRDPIADDQLWIVMEYCNGGSVTDLVKHMKEKGEALPEDLISYILREVLAGLSYLHSAHVIHRDVKGQNVLLTSDARVKLIDFGISAVVEKTLGRRRTTIGTPYWMAPEVIACEQQVDYDYDARADIWSLGITAIEIADSTPPLFGENPMRALFKIPKNEPPTLRCPSKWSRQLNDFIAKCLCKDFERRSTSHELLAHTFVSFVPKDPKLLRRKLMTLIDLYQHGKQMDMFAESSSSSTSGIDTTRRNMKSLKTTEIVHDLATLEYIDESVIVSQLCKRYKKRLVYTYVGDILISINPFQKLDIYSEKYSQLHCSATRGQLPPHIFAVAGSAYQAMVQECRDQCCVVSGESGAGKTEASNILVQQFMKLGRAATRSLEEKILKVNPLMESFGNARTVINGNSSRFGKYLELHFTLNGLVVGARLSEYLLEKSRVVSQARRERNFHIFYYLLAGLGTRHQLAKYKLKSTHYRYLEHRGTVKGSSKRNALFSEKFNQIESALYLFGFTKGEFESVCCILAAILNIGNVRLETHFHPHIGEVSIVSNRDLIDDVASLLQIKPEKFEKALTTSKVITYGETIVRPNTIEQAMDIRDAMAKALYGRLFSWIVNKINPELNPPSSSTKLLNIGILDIFGFENFRTNSFEQLCINIANEQLQFYFNQHIFAWEQEEYECEGIDLWQVGYQDNRPLLELLLSRPMGLLALLDEESKFPRASDLSLAAKFHDNFQASPYYKKPKDRGPTFTVLHYAGPVTYETACFLEKNRDTLRADVSYLLKMSQNSIVRSLFYTPLSRTGSLSTVSMANQIPPSATPLFSRKAPIKRGHRFQSQPARPSSAHGRTPLSSSGNITASRPQTVSTYFINSLRELMAKMLAGTPHFVRCIRPNELKSPDQFQTDKVLVQLRYTGVLETTRIRKEGFSHRILFEDFVQRYKVVSFPLSTLVKATPTNCVQILMQAGLKDWALGKTKIFLKYYHMERLVQILNSYDRAAIVVQRVVKGWMGRRKVARMREEKRRRAVVRIQAAVRGFLARCRYQKLQLLREKAALTIQTAVRVWLARSSFLTMLQRRQLAAIRIQAAVRMWLCRQQLLRVKRHREKMAVKIQTAVRMWLCRQQLLRVKCHREKMAVKIQTAVRMWLCRQQLLRMKHHREKMAVKIQTAVRSWLSRQRLEEARMEHEKESAGSLRQKLHHRAVASVRLLEAQLHQNQDHVLREKSNQDHALREKNNQDHALREKSGQDIVLREKSGQDIVLREKSGQDIVLREKSDQDIVLREKNNQDHALREKSGQDIVLREKSGQDIVLREKSDQDHALREKSGQDIVLREKSGQDIVLREKSGQDIVLREKSGQDIVLREKSGQDIVLREKSGQDIVLREKSDQDHALREKSDQDHALREKNNQDHALREKSAYIIQKAYRRKCSCRQAQKKVEEMRKQAEEEQQDVGKFLHKMECDGLNQFKILQRTAAQGPFPRPVVFLGSRHQRTSSPRVQRKQLHQQVIKHGDKVLWRPSVLPYFARQQIEPKESEETQWHHPLPPASQTQHTRRIFEDLIAKQTQEALRDSPIVRRQRRNSNKKAYLHKEKPHSKPDSVFQKLIDRFDPMRLTSGAKTRVKS